jgi:hypothetical protein
VNCAVPAFRILFVLLFVPRPIVMAPALHHRDHLQTIRNAVRFLGLACS